MISACIENPLSLPAESAGQQPPLPTELDPNRCFGELTVLLPQLNCAQLLALGPVLARAIPELSPMIGFDQHSPHHAFDVFTHTAYVTARVPAEPVLRWAALLHDVGKVPCFTRDDTGRGHFYGHAAQGARMARDILTRLGASPLITDQVCTLIEGHMYPLKPDPEDLCQWADRLGWDILEKLVALKEADHFSKGIPEETDPPFYFRLRTVLSRIKPQETGGPL